MPSAQWQPTSWSSPAFSVTTCCPNSSVRPSTTTSPCRRPPPSRLTWTSNRRRSTSRNSPAVLPPTARPLLSATHSAPAHAHHSTGCLTGRVTTPRCLVSCSGDPKNWINQSIRLIDRLNDWFFLCIQVLCIQIFSFPLTLNGFLSIDFFHFHFLSIVSCRKKVLDWK